MTGQGVPRDWASMNNAQMRVAVLADLWDEFDDLSPEPSELDYSGLNVEYIQNKIINWIGDKTIPEATRKERKGIFVFFFDMYAYRGSVLGKIMDSRVNTDEIRRKAELMGLSTRRGNPGSAGSLPASEITLARFATSFAQFIFRADERFIRDPGFQTELPKRLRTNLNPSVVPLRAQWATTWCHMIKFCYDFDVMIHTNRKDLDPAQQGPNHVVSQDIWRYFLLAARSNTLSDADRYKLCTDASIGPMVPVVPCPEPLKQSLNHYVNSPHHLPAEVHDEIVKILAS